MVGKVRLDDKGKKEIGVITDIGLGVSPIDGKHLSGTVERATFFASVLLAAIGILLLLIYVILPIIGIALGIALAIIGFGVIIVGVAAAIAIIRALMSGILESRSRDDRRDDYWDE